MAIVKKQTKTGTRKGPLRRVSPKTTTRETSSATGWMGRRPFAFVGYGPSGIGKTSLAANFPKVAFVHDPQETGIEDLVEFGQVPPPHEILQIDTWKTLLETVDAVAMGKKAKGAETLVIDSLTGVEKLCFHHHCRENFDSDWSSKGFFAYMQGPKNAAKTDWPELLDLLEACRGNGINVFLVAHSVVKPYNNPEGHDYDRHVPKMEKDIWDATHRWAQAVFFMNEVVEVDKDGTRRKAKGGSERRNLYTERTGAFDAKNRMGLPPVIDMGDSGKEAFENLKDAFDNLGQ